MNIRHYIDLIEAVQAYHGTNSSFHDFDIPPNATDPHTASLFHFGNIEQASDRIATGYQKYGNGANIRRVNLNIHNSLRMPDIIEWSPYTIIEFILTHRSYLMINNHEIGDGAISKLISGARKLWDDHFSLVFEHQDEFEAKIKKYKEEHGEKNLKAFIREEIKKDALLNRKLVHDLLQSCGFDSIVYHNEIEGVGGDSYLVFDNKQIKPWFHK